MTKIMTVLSSEMELTVDAICKGRNMEYERNSI
jgi:hypothetical protein